MRDGLDFYYKMGFLINFYAHGLSTGDQGPKPYPLTAGYLIPDYIQYGMNAQLHTNLWPVNARELYQWWLNRSPVQVASSHGTNGSHSVALAAISGAQDTNTAIEVLAVGAGSAIVSQVLANGSLADTNSYRTVGEVIKVRVGTTITNVQVEYYPGPFARNDTYRMVQGQSLAVSSAAGVLSNDWSGIWSGLSAILNSGPSRGPLTLNLDGSFTYTPTNAFWGTECFTYEATDGQRNFGIATVTINVMRTNSFFDDDFTRCSGSQLTPWQAAPAPWSGQWNLGSGALLGNSAAQNYAFCYITNTWSDFTVEGQVQFPTGAFGGGLGARLSPNTGAHYAAWIYPEGSSGGSNVLKLVKFYGWGNFGYNGTNYASMAEAALQSVGTVSHSLKLVLNADHIDVYYDSAHVISTDDTDSAAAPFTSGAVSADMWTDITAYNMSVSRVVVSP
jgi:hypothetical protein